MPFSMTCRSAPVTATNAVRSKRIRKGKIATSMAEFAERFGTNQALVPESLAVKYSIKRLNPQSRLRVRVRSGIFQVASRAKDAVRPIVERNERDGRVSPVRKLAKRLRSALR